MNRSPRAAIARDRGVYNRPMHSTPAIPQSELRLSVAPMMDWTDTHCRVFHRILAPHARLYTEMVHANAVLHGDRRKLLTPPFHGKSIKNYERIIEEETLRESDRRNWAVKCAR